MTEMKEMEKDKIKKKLLEIKQFLLPNQHHVQLMEDIFYRQMGNAAIPGA